MRRRRPAPKVDAVGHPCSPTYDMATWLEGSGSAAARPTHVTREAKAINTRLMPLQQVVTRAANHDCPKRGNLVITCQQTQFGLGLNDFQCLLNAHATESRACSPRGAVDPSGSCDDTRGRAVERSSLRPHELRCECAPRAAPRERWLTGLLVRRAK